MSMMLSTMWVWITVARSRVYEGWVVDLEPSASPSKPWTKERSSEDLKATSLERLNSAHFTCQDPLQGHWPPSEKAISQPSAHMLA